jgi:hypothetical protein
MSSAALSARFPAMAPRGECEEEVSERLTSLMPAFVPANVSLIMRS